MRLWIVRMVALALGLKLWPLMHGDFIVASQPIDPAVARAVTSPWPDE